MHLPNRLIVFATQEEAQATLNTPPSHHDLVVITGMGSLAAAAAVAKSLASTPSIDEVWNIGIAGALNQRLPLESVCYISTVTKYLSLPTGIDDHSRQLAKRTFPPIVLQEKGYSLISSNYPIHHPEIRDELAQQADLVDMEGYGVALAAAQAHKRCCLCKVVSDPADFKGPALIKAKLPLLSHTMAKILQLAHHNIK